ncbi:MATE family efflux transporter [Sesbania bispinosa]|nr:MATE family efflux transporter [Sesbania bispinosa]
MRREGVPGHPPFRVISVLWSFHASAILCRFFLAASPSPCASVSVAPQLTPIARTTAPPPVALRD